MPTTKKTASKTAASSTSANVTTTPKKTPTKKTPTKKTTTTKASPKKSAPRKAAETPAVEAPEKKAAAAPEAPKVEAGPSIPTTEESTGGDAPLVKNIRWTKLKRAVISTLQKMEATKALDAKTAAQVAEASDGQLTEAQVKHQCFHKFDLVVFGYVKQSKLESRELGFYLTAKGKSKKFD